MKRTEVDTCQQTIPYINYSLTEKCRPDLCRTAFLVQLKLVASSVLARSPLKEITRSYNNKISPCKDAVTPNYVSAHALNVQHKTIQTRYAIYKRMLLCSLVHPVLDKTGDTLFF